MSRILHCSSENAYATEKTWSTLSALDQLLSKGKTNEDSM